MTQLSFEDWADHASDMFGDMPIYLEQAGRDSPCEKCSGTGKMPLPSGNDDLKRELCLGLLVAFGGRTSHAFPGDPCTWCEGSGVDARKRDALAAERFAKDWYPTMCELFGPKP